MYPTNQQRATGEGTLAVRLPLCHAMKEDGELAVQLHTFLASELDEGEGLASHPGRHPTPPPRNKKEKLQDLSILLPQAMSKTFLKDEKFHFQGREKMEFSSVQ